MGRYGIDSTMPEACVETPKDLKKRIKKKELALEDFIKLSRVIDLEWKEKNAVIGNLYMEIREMKQRQKGK